MSALRGHVALAGVLIAILLSIPGCGGGATPPPSHPASAATPAAATVVATGCSSKQLPPAFRPDDAHSGKLTAHNYSAAADVQAALEYDQLQAGAREVFLQHAAGKVSSVVSCVAMRFATQHLASRFFMSYRALRKQAGSLVQRVKVPAVPGLSGLTGYLESQQSFRGYGIDSTNVLELSGRDGSRLDIVSVSGPEPSQQLARKLLGAMAGEQS